MDQRYCKGLEKYSDDEGTIPLIADNEELD